MTQALGDERIGRVPGRGRELEHDRRELLSHRIVQLTRERRAFAISSGDDVGGKRTHLRAIRGESVEQDVEHRPDAEHLIVGDRGPLHAGAVVAVPDVRGDALEIANGPQRDQHETQVNADDRADHENDDAVERSAGDEPHGRQQADDEEVRADELRDERHSQRGESNSSPGLERCHAWTTNAVTMPNIPCSDSACGRMWQWNAHVPGLLH